MIFAGRLNISGLEASCSYELGTPQFVFLQHPAIEELRQRAHAHMGGTGSADQVRKQILLSLFFWSVPILFCLGFTSFFFF